MNTSNTIEAARDARDNAIESVSGNAGATWNEMAYAALVVFVKTNGPFMAEDVRLTCTHVPTPHDNRAWGGVFNRAVRANVIKRVGYAQSKTGHCRPMPLWERA